MTEPVPVDGCEGVYRVDTELFGPGFMSAYVVRGGTDPDAPVAIVDPGPASGADRVVAAVDELGLGDAVEVVVPTHVHLDHAGATGALARAYPDATVYCHERGREYLTDAEALSRLVAGARRAVGEGVVAAYGDPEPVPAGRCEPLSGGERLRLGDRTLSVVETPGHAPHQVGLADGRDGALFAGDAAGMWLGGDLSPTTPPPDFDPEVWQATVARLREHDPRVVCYGHFGARPDADAALAEYEDLLAAWVAAVEAARAATGTDDVASVVEELDDRWQTPTVTADVAGVLASLDG